MPFLLAVIMVTSQYWWLISKVTETLPADSTRGKERCDCIYHNLIQKYISNACVFILDGWRRMMSFTVKSRDWAASSQSAISVKSRTQAAGQASIIGWDLPHAAVWLVNVQDTVEGNQSVNKILKVNILRVGERQRQRERKRWRWISTSGVGDQLSVSHSCCCVRCALLH
jgi:hypothetical protein